MTIPTLPARRRAVLTPRTAAEVAAVVVRARSSGRRVVVVEPTGPRAADPDAVQVELSALSQVRVEPRTHRCRVGGGAVWAPVVAAATAYGLAVLPGGRPDRGVVDHSLTGGLGPYARRLGLAANQVTAVELVTGDGTVVRSDAEHHPELFWALRGGGSLGIVTALELRLHPITSAYAGLLAWDLNRAEAVLRRWAGWAEAAPDAVTTSFRRVDLPPDPDLPASLRGHSVVAVDGAVLAADEDAAHMLRELRALRPEVDTFARVPTRDLVRRPLDPTAAAPTMSERLMLSGLPDGAMEAFLGAVGPGATHRLRGAELGQLGGALARPQPGAGVASHLNGRFLAVGVAAASTPEVRAQGLVQVRQLTGALSPYASGSASRPAAEHDHHPPLDFSPDAWRRLSAVRSAVDPDGIFAAPSAGWDTGSPS